MHTQPGWGTVRGRLPFSRGLVPSETTRSGRCIWAKRVQRVRSAYIGEENRVARGDGGGKEAREVHGAPRAPRFAWPRSSVSRAKAAGAPPHWTNCATFMLLGSFSLYFTTRQSSIFFPRSLRSFWRTLNTRVEINDSLICSLRWEVWGWAWV